MRMHAFKVGEHDLSVQRVTMLDARVFYDFAYDRVAVLTGEVTSAARAGLGTRHDEP